MARPTKAMMAARERGELPAPNQGGRKKFIGKPLDFRGDFLDHLRKKLTDAATITFPTVRYRNDPRAFAREILGQELWHKQVEICDALLSSDQVVVRGAQKVGKSNTAAVLALWYYCSYDDARVLLCATTENQVNRVLYRELRRLIAQSGRCMSCRIARESMLDNGKVSESEADREYPMPCAHSARIDGDLGATADSGLQSGLRQIVGLVARNQESVAGISGARQLWICDEASGMSGEFLQAATGNLAGGGKIVLISNPTRLHGFFFDAFHRASRAWKPVHVSALDSPNVTAGKLLIPGLATTAWLDNKKEEHGETSPFYRVRCLGEFPASENGLIFGLEKIAAAEARWHTYDLDSLADERLWIGLDPAGPAGEGDESVFCVRRAKYVYGMFATRGLDADGHLAYLLGIIREHGRKRDQKPVVVVDADGKLGSELCAVLGAHARASKDFVLAPLRGSDKPARNPKIYNRQRDETTANLEAAFADGLAIPEDTKLQNELHSVFWAQKHDGKYQIYPPKDELRKELQRSPDRYDALSLCCWEPLDLKDLSSASDTVKKMANPTPASADLSRALRSFGDPYSGGYRR